jgi:hypothetical protein
MNERSRLIEYLRGELVGPSRPLAEPTLIEFVDGVFIDVDPARRGPVAWRPHRDAELEEVLYYDRDFASTV